ncbi:hypothetical protein D9M68_553350 [compost metagenome]
MAQLAAVGAGNRFLAGRIDLHQQQHVGLAEHLHEVLVEITGAGETVRLVDHHQAPFRPAAAHGLDHRRDFARVVAVVVDQHHAAAVDLQFAVHLEAPADALEAGQALDDGLVGNALVGGDDDGRQGVQHVVQARHVHRDIQRRALGAQHGEEGTHAFLADVDRADVGVLAETVGDHRARHLRQDLAHHRVVHAHHRQTVERQVVQELDEGLLQLVEVAAVGAHVVGVDVGHHRHHRLQVQEAGVALVGLGHQVAAGAELGVGAGRVQAAADDEGRVEAAGGEHRGDQAGGGGLAVGAGDGDAVAVAHQLGEHFRARHHRQATFEGGGDFRVGLVHGAGDDQHVGAIGVFRAMADEYLRAELLQALGHRRGLEVGAGDFVAEVQQHFGDAAHAGATDADEVDAADAAHGAGDTGGFLNHGPPPGRHRLPCG